MEGGQEELPGRHCSQPLASIQRPGSKLTCRGKPLPERALCFLASTHGTEAAATFPFNAGCFQHNQEAVLMVPRGMDARPLVPMWGGRGGTEPHVVLLGSDGRELPE